jgi:phage tail sheath protein FI
MPVTPALSYPGVYIQEVPSGVRTIIGVPTSMTAFIGRARRGPLNQPTFIENFGGFQRRFGDLWQPSTMSYAVQQYFTNGGGQALIVRVADAAASRATLSLPAGGSTLELEAASEGAWGDQLFAAVDHDEHPSPSDDFNLTIYEGFDAATGQALLTESYPNVSIDTTSRRYVEKVLEERSELVRARMVPGTRPNATTPGSPLAVTTQGSDGGPITDLLVVGGLLSKSGIYALEKADLFNILCIPPLQPDVDVGTNTWSAALAYCKSRRAMLIVDSPAAWNDPDDVIPNVPSTLRDPNAALYFPRVRMSDPLLENRPRNFAPCGAVAGIYARTDGTRGVWKAAAGQEATVAGALDFSVKLSDGENGRLNPIGVNCLRTFNIGGVGINVVWGARTLRGADVLASEWKYVPVRRTALFIEETLYRNTQWVVFEPNDEPLWAQIRLSIGAFMHDLFRQGAFQGSTPRDAYFVKCDKETTTQNDIDRGIVNIIVGFAPLKPAEFVVIYIQQIAGQIQT